MFGFFRKPKPTAVDRSLTPVWRVKENADFGYACLRKTTWTTYEQLWTSGWTVQLANDYKLYECFKLQDGKNPEWVNATDLRFPASHVTTE